MMKNSTAEERARRNARLTSLLARSDLRGPAIAAMMGCTTSYVNRKRSEWHRAEVAAGRSPTCACGGSIVHLGQCFAIAPIDRPTIRIRLRRGDMLDEIAKDMGYDKASIVHFHDLYTTDEDKAERCRTSRSIATKAWSAKRRAKAERRARMSDPAWIAERDRLVLDFSVSIGEVAERLGLTPQCVGQRRKAEFERCRSAGLPVPAYAGGPNSGRTLGPRVRLDRKRIVAALQGDDTLQRIAKRLGVPFNHVQRVFFTLPAAFQRARISRVTAAANRRNAAGRTPQFGAKHVADPVHSAVRAVVTNSLPSELAEDVVQELVVKVLAGEATIVDMAEARRRTLAEQRRILGMSLGGPTSLDEKVFEDGSTTRMDMLADETADDEDAILDRIDRDRERERAWRMVA